MFITFSQQILNDRLLLVVTNKKKEILVVDSN